MKAFSVRQPWAWVILQAGRDIENRTWPTRYRGRVLVHASRTYASEAEDWIEERFGIEVPPDIGQPGPPRKPHADVLQVSFTGPYSWFRRPDAPSIFDADLGRESFAHLIAHRQSGRVNARSTSHALSCIRVHHAAQSHRCKNVSRQAVGELDAQCVLFHER
jgi:hypothetical protein